jgi:hypothetical protein
MSPSMIVATMLTFAPAQVPAAGKLEIANVRNTYGVLGPTRADSKLIPGDILFVSYDIDGITIDKDGRVHYSMVMEVVDKNGKATLKQDPFEKIELVPLGGSRVAARAFVTLGVDHPAGEFTMKVSVTDKAEKANKATTTLERKFEVLAPDFGIVAVYASLDERGQTAAPTTGVVGQAVFINYTAVGFKREEKTKQPNLHFEMIPLDENAKPLMAKPLFHDGTDLDEKLPNYTVRFLLPMTRPGKFTIRLSCTDVVTKKTVSVDLPVLVLAGEK